MTNASTNPRVVRTPVRLPPCSIRRARTRLPVSRPIASKSNPSTSFSTSTKSQVLLLCLRQLRPKRRERSPMIGLRSACYESGFSDPAEAFRSESNRSSRRHEH
jgi:hypothetical protein